MSNFLDSKKRNIQDSFFLPAGAFDSAWMGRKMGGEVRTFTVKQQRAVLRALIRSWSRAFRPVISRALWLQKRYFTEGKYREIIGEMLLCEGDLDAVKAAWKNKNEKWRAAFFVWAEKVKGGAL